MIEWKNKGLQLLCRAVLLGAAVATLGAFQVASAQGIDDADDEVIEEVVVTGYRASIIAAREAKRMSDSISDAIVAEDIGKSTDSNIAEALSRVTGISIQSEDGIGLTVTVRGIDPNLNMVMMNGVELGSSGDGRAVDLSAFSADMLSKIEVVKTANASHNEGSLGGTINLTTKRPLSRGKDRVTTEVEWRSTDFDGEDNFKVSLGLNKKFADDRFGIAATVVQDNQFRRSDSFSSFDWRIDSYLDPVSLQTGQTLPGRVYGVAPRASVQRIKAFQRDNTTANVVFQFQPTDTSDFYLDLTYSNLDMVTDLFQLQAKNWHANNPTADTPNPGRPIPGTAIFDEDTQTYVFGQSDRVVSFLQNRHVEEERETITATLGGSLDVGPWTMDARVSHMDLSQDLPIWHQINFQRVIGNPAPTVPSGFSCGMEIDPATNDVTPGGTQVGTPGTCGILFGTWWDINDPDSGPRLAQARVNGRTVNDEATSLFLDFSYDDTKDNDIGGVLGDFLSLFTSVEFGGKYSDRSKDRFQNDVSAATEIDAGNNVPISQYANPFPFSDPWLGGEGAPGSVTDWIVPDIAESFAFLWPSGVPGTSPNPLQTWDVSEEVVALYLMANFESGNGKLFGNIGVRHVDTVVDATGNSGITFRPPRPTYFTLLDSDCTSVQGGNCFVETPVNESKRYSQWLPSLNINYLLSDDMMLRLGLSKTMARPSFNDLRPNGNLDIRSFSESTFKGGNPLLNPLVSNNIDLSFEWYFGEANLLAAALFYKDMQDFVFTKTILRQYENPFTGEPFRDETQGLGPDGQFPFAEIQTTTAVNGAAAEIRGLELAYQHTFDDLLPWGGLGVVFNYTYTDSEADYDAREGELDPYNGYPLINTSENTYNATVFFENDRVAARLAYNWRSERLVSPAARQMSTWADATGSLDASFNIYLTDRVSLTGNAVNLTDEVPRLFQTVAFVNGNQPGVVVEGNAFDSSIYDGRTQNLNYYGRTFRLGVRVAF